MSARKCLKRWDGSIIIESPERVSVYTLLERLKEKGRDFAGIDLSSLKLPGLVISHKNLKKSKLFHGEYQLSTFSRSTMRDVDWSDSDFSNCYFIGCDMRYSKFENCIFDGSDFSGANISGCNFKNSSFKKCDLKNIIVDEDTDFTKCDFSYANMIGEQIMSANFDMTKIDRKVKIDFGNFN